MEKFFALPLKRLPRVIRVAINRAVYRGPRSRGKAKVFGSKGRKTSRLTSLGGGGGRIEKSAVFPANGRWLKKFGFNGLKMRRIGDNEANSR